MFVSPSTVAVLRQRTKAVRCWVQTMSQSYTTSAAPPPAGGWRVRVTRHRAEKAAGSAPDVSCETISNSRDSAARPALRERHCRRLHAIEQLLKMKPHSMRPILADRGVDVVAAGRRVSGARPGTFVRYLTVVVILESQSRWPTVADSRLDAPSVFGPGAFHREELACRGAVVVRRW
jgi:hypothetical protein